MDTITELAREVIATLGNPQDMSPRQFEVFEELLFFKQCSKEIAKSGKLFATDRTIFDVLAYAYDTDIYPILLEYAKIYLERNAYTHIFYFPIEFDMEKDWVRPEDEEYRIRIDKNIRHILWTLEIPYYTVTWSVDERVAYIESIIYDN